MSLLDRSEFGEPLLDPPEQAAYIARWLADLPVPVALCSGNHEVDEYVDIWKTQNPTNITIDLETRVIGEAVVTCLPFIFGFTTPESTIDGWLEGKATAEGIDQWWLVLHHEPPVEGRRTDSPSQLLGQYQPDIYLCGHIHDWPSQHSFAVRNRGVIVLNPGVGEDLKTPNHIVIDTTALIATWFCPHEAFSISVAVTSRIFRPAAKRV